MGLEKFRIRDDAKWGHPELEVAYSLMGNSVGYAEVLLNDDLSFEERQNFAAHAEDGFKDYLPDYDWSRVTEYEAQWLVQQHQMAQWYSKFGFDTFPDIAQSTSQTCEIPQIDHQQPRL